MTGYARAGSEPPPNGAPISGGELVCDGVSLEAAAAAHGTPLYVYSRPAIEAAYAAYAQAFAAVPHRICYAVKANGNGAILRLLAGLGAGADIVSGGELLAALRAGFPRRADRLRGRRQERRRDRTRARARDRGVERRERGRDRAAGRGGRGARHARARLAARQPRHRRPLAPVHLDRAARGQVRRRHRCGRRRSCAGRASARGSTWSECSATSARRSSTRSRSRRRRGRSRA